MTKKRDFISEGYAHGEGGKNAPAFYDSWSADYDADTLAEGYITPWRCADALRSVCPDVNGPLADLGCGSGISGEAFASRGFAPIDGFDFSEAMLDVARTKNCYRALTQVDLSQEDAFPDDRYFIAALLGVLHPDHAPPEVLDRALAALPVGGFLVFYMSETVAANPLYSDLLERIDKGGSAETVFQEMGPHLPRRGIEALVTVLRRTAHSDN